MSEDDEKAQAESASSEQLNLIPETAFKRFSDIKTDYRIADSEAALKQLLDELTTAGIFAFDTETTSLNPRSSRLVGISFSTKAHSGWFVPIPDNSGSTASVYEMLRPVFSDDQLASDGTESCG